MGMQQLWWSPSSVTANPQLCWLLPLNKGNPSLIKTDSWKFIFTQYLLSLFSSFTLKVMIKIMLGIRHLTSNEVISFWCPFLRIVTVKNKHHYREKFSQFKIKKLNWTTTAPKFQAINKCWYLHFSLS